MEHIGKSTVSRSVRKVRLALKRFLQRCSFDFGAVAMVNQIIGAPLMVFFNSCGGRA